MPFDGTPPFSDTHLPRALSERRPVLVVDPPLGVHRWRPGQPLRSAARLERLGDRLWRFRPLALPGRDRALSALASDRLIARQVERAARRVLPARRVLVTFSPARGWLDGLRREVSVYWRRDMAAQSHYVTSVRHTRARHRKILQRADLVTAVSPELVADAKRDNPRAVLLPNGADVGHFARRAAPPPVLARRSPVIGYAGAVSWRVDVGLLDEVARARPDWSVVLVGEVSVPVPRRPNLVVVGARPYDELPAWVQSFDVGLIPYTGAAFNRASFPLKVFDYLASGVPVVSSPLPALDSLSPCVRLAEGAAATVSAIEAALRCGPSPELCRSLAASNSWQARAEALESLVDERLAARAVR
jgi:glycosyltransferase involved in cell wall biosynthesis